MTRTQEEERRRPTVVAATEVAASGAAASTTSTATAAAAIMEAARAVNSNGGRGGGRGGNGRGGRGRGRKRKRAGGRPAGSRKTQASAQSQATSGHGNSTVVITSTRRSTRQQNNRAPQGHTSSGSAQAVSEGQSEQTQAPSIREGAKNKTRSTGKYGNARYQLPNGQVAEEREISHLPASLLADERVIYPLPAHLLALAHPRGNLRKTDVWVGDKIKWKYESGEIADSYWYWNERWWEALFDELVSYKQANGHTNVPEDGSGLGGWVRQQREKFAIRRLDRVKIARLEEIGFDWLRDIDKHYGRSPTVQWRRGENDWEWGIYDSASRQWRQSTLAEFLANYRARLNPDSIAKYRAEHGL